MRRLLFGVSLLLIAQFSFSQETTESFDLKGRVRFIEEAKCNLVKNNGVYKKTGNIFGRSGMIFNEKGNLIKKYEIPGNVESIDTINIVTYDYQYDLKGQVAEFKEYIKINHISETKLKFFTKNTFDQNGLLIKKMVYNDKGSFEKGRAYTYAKKEVKVDVLDSEGNFDEYGINTDDSIIGDISIDQTNYTEQVMDSKGNWVQKIGFSWESIRKGIERRILYF